VFVGVAAIAGDRGGVHFRNCDKKSGNKKSENQGRGRAREGAGMENGTGHVKVSRRSRVKSGRGALGIIRETWRRMNQA